MLASIAGCNNFLTSGEPKGGEGDTIEVIVENLTDMPVRLAIRLDDQQGESLFSRVYDLDPERRDESAGIETRPATINAFTPDGDSKEWDYAPDINVDCEGKDVVIAVEDELYLRYSC